MGIAVRVIAWRIALQGTGIHFLSTKFTIQKILAKIKAPLGRYNDYNHVNSIFKY